MYIIIGVYTVLLTIYCQEAFEFAHHTYLDSDDLFELFWTQLNDTHIDIGLKVETKGWISIGISPNGNMIHSDFMFSWIDDNDGSIHLQNRHTSNNLEPPILSATQNNIQLISGEQNHNYTQIQFIRQIHPCDSNSKSINKQGATKIIWAFSEYDPVFIDTNSTELSWISKHYYKHKGSKSIDLLAQKEYVHNSHLLNDTKSINFTMHNYSIPAQPTKYRCKMVQFPSSNNTESYTYHIIGYRPIITAHNEPFVHHIILYTCTGTVHDSWIGNEEDCFFGENMLDTNMCQRGEIVHVWDVGGSEEIYDYQYGYKINAGNYGILEIHYDNYDLSEITSLDNSGLMVYYTDKLREKNIKLLTVASVIDDPLDFFIPAGLSNIAGYGYCSAHATKQLIPKYGIHVHKVYLHAHQNARALVLRHIRNGIELEPITANYHYDFNFQEIVELDTPRTIHQGDEIIIECIYDTTNRNVMVFQGDGTENEMCVASLFVTSDPDIVDPYCLSTFTKTQLDEWLQKPQMNGWYDNNTMVYNTSHKDSEYYYRRMWRDLSIATVKVDESYSLVADYQIFSILPFNYQTYESVDICDVYNISNYSEINVNNASNTIISSRDGDIVNLKRIFSVYLLLMLCSLAMIPLMYVLVQFIRFQKVKSMTQLNQNKIEKVFALIGAHMYQHPHIFLFCGLFFTIISVFSAIHVEFDDDVHNLWNPQDSEIWQQYRTIIDNFEEFPQRLIMFLEPNQENINIFSPLFLNESWHIFTQVNKLKITYKDKEYKYEDICLQSSATTTKCDSYSSNIFSFFSNNPENWQNEESYTFYMASLKYFEHVDVFFGGLQYLNNESIPYNAKYLILSWFIKNDSNDIENKFLIKFQTFCDKLAVNNNKLFNVHYYTTRSFSDELQKVAFDSVWLLPLCAFIILMYLIISLGTMSCTGFRVLLALSIIPEIICELIVGLAIFQLLGFKLNLLMLSVIPFIALSVGIDDMIIIIEAYDNNQKYTTEKDRFVSAVTQTGLAITTTSLTTVIAYLAGGLTSTIEAVKNGCYFGAIIFTINYIYQYLVFVPLFVYDNQRQQQGRNFCCPCFKHKDAGAQQEKVYINNKYTIQYVLHRTIVPLLNHAILRKMIVFFFVCLIPFGIYSTINVERGGEMKDLLADDSHLMNLFNLQKHENISSPMSIILRDQNIYNQDVYTNILNTIKTIDNNDHTIGNIEHWLYDFDFYLLHYDNISDRNDLSQFQFYQHLDEFLNHSLHNKWQTEIIFDDEDNPSKAKYIRFIGYFYTNLDESYHKSWNLRNQYLEAIKMNIGNNGFVFYDQWLTAYLGMFIFQYSFISISISIVAICIALCYSFNIKSSIITAIIMIMININIFSCMKLFQISLNPFTNTMLIASVGLSVDYVIHIVYAFDHNKHNHDDDDFISHLITNVGVAVMKGAFTTCIGMSVLIFSKFEMYRIVCVIFVCIVIVSLLHGLLFAPALLMELHSAKKCNETLICTKLKSASNAQQPVSTLSNIIVTTEGINHSKQHTQSSPYQTRDIEIITDNN